MKHRQISFSHADIRPQLMTSTSLATRFITAAALALVPFAPVVAGPEDPVVIAGDVRVTRPDDGRTDILQGSDRAIVNWQDFSIGLGETVNFVQPSAASIILNRVVGDQASEIFGNMNANGRVLLVNRNGVLFGPEARVDVAGLIATTSDIDDADFMSDRLLFDGGNSPSGQVINKGSISARDFGLVALVAPHVENSGVIAAKFGQVTLAAGSHFTLDLYGDQLIQLAVDEAFLPAGGASPSITHAGSIFADGGTVHIDARSAAGVVESVINMSGVVEARAVAEHDGRIIISGGHTGAVELSGLLSVDQVENDGNAGSILVTGDSIQASQTAEFSANATETGLGGDIRLLAETRLSYTASASARGGRTAGDGGFVETSGSNLMIGETARVDTSATNGAYGMWSLDPEVLNVVESASGDSDVAASVIVSQLESTNVELAATETINVNAAIDSSSQSSTTNLSFVDEDGDGDLTINLNAAINLGANQSLSGQGATVYVASGTSVQNGIDVSATGATVNVAAGSYSENLVVSTAGLTLAGAQAGITANGRTGSESQIVGNVHLTGDADGTTIDGLTVSEGALVQGSRAGVYIDRGATGITIENTIFTRSGTVDGDGYRGILTAIDGGQTSLLIKNNSFLGWATGIYLNPGATDATVTGNSFDNNFVGMSVDGPNGVTISNNIFSNSVFEGLGFGPWTSSSSAPVTLSATVSGNSFADSNAMHAGLYFGNDATIDFSGNSFGGINTADMNIVQLLAVAAKIGDGIDTSGGYSGYASLRNGHVLVTDGGSINSGIGFAQVGDTVNVGAGTYAEDVTIDKSVTLQGSGSGTVIQGQNSGGSAVLVSSSNVTLGGAGANDGFTINGAGTSAVHLSEGVSGVTVQNNVVVAAENQIALDTQGSLQNVVIDSNSFTAAGSGTTRQLVYINGLASLGAGRGSDNVDITNNQFSGAAQLALGLEASNSDVTGNSFSGANSYATVELWAAPTSFANNTFTAANAAHILRSANSNTGAITYESAQSLVANNTVSSAVYIAGTDDVVVNAGQSNTIGGDVQTVINSSVDGDTLHLTPGTYNSLTTHNGSNLGLVIDRSITLQGVDSNGNAISNSANVAATIVSGAESNWGTNFYVTAPNVTINGLAFQAAAGSVDPESPSNAVNKAFEILADNFIFTNSVIDAASGYNFSGKTSASLYFGDEGDDDLNNFTVDNNILGGGITITNGAGDGDGPVNFTITNNTVSGSHFLRVRGNVDGVAWLNAEARMPTTMTGNDVTGVTDFIIQYWGANAGVAPDMDFINGFIANNTVGGHVYATDANGALRFQDYSEYGATQSGFILEKQIQGVADIAVSGDTINIGAGTYTENVEIKAGGITLSGTQAGTAAAGRSGAESNLTGSIHLTGDADDTVIDGLTISEGGSVQGSNAGVYIDRSATNVTIQNTAFTRNGTVDGDGYRGILSVSGGDQTGLLVQNNSFTGWATGIYLNPGATGAQVSNNSFNNNFVGMSVDGPSGTIISGNSFTSNVFEGLGLGPGTDPISVSVSGNDFTGNTTHLGLYVGNDVEVDVSSNSFGGVSATSMTLDQLLAVEAALGHGVDSGGYSGLARLRSGYIFLNSGGDVAAGVGFAAAGETVLLGNGTYTVASTLNIDKSITLSGQSEGSTNVDASGVSGYGIHVTADNVNLSNFTLFGPSLNASSSYGIKVNPDTSDAADRLLNFAISDVTVRGSGRAELDLNGVAGATITNVTADGRVKGDDTTETAGAGIQLTDTSGVTLTGVETIGNSWGSVALYQANRSYDQQTSNINIDATANTFNEFGGLYSQDSSDSLDFGTLNLTNFSHTVENSDFRSDAQQFVFYRTSEQDAIDYAASLTSTSFIRGWTGTTSTNNFVVGVATGGTAMSIQSALDQAASGSTVSVRNGTYSENLTMGTDGVKLAGDSGATLSVAEGQTGISITGDNVTVSGMTITGPFSDNFTAVDWDNTASTFGVVASASATGFVIENNLISNLRTGVSLSNGSAGTVRSNQIDNTKGAILVRTDDLTLTGNSEGSQSNEWGIVFLTGVTDGAYTTSPTVSEANYGADIMALSTANSGMSVLDRRYGSNGLLGLAPNVGNRSHVHVGVGSTFTAQDDFDLGNGLGNARQPLGSVSDATSAAVIGGAIIVGAGDYDENLTFDGQQTFSFQGATFNAVNALSGVTPGLQGNLASDTFDLTGGFSLTDDLALTVAGDLTLPELSSSHALSIAANAINLSGTYVLGGFSATGSVLLLADTEVNTSASGGNIVFNNAITATLAGQDDLTLNAGAGDITHTNIGAEDLRIGDLTVVANSYDGSAGTTYVVNMDATVSGDASLGNNTLNASGRAWTCFGLVESLRII